MVGERIDTNPSQDFQTGNRSLAVESLLSQALNKISRFQMRKGLPVMLPSPVEVVSPKDNEELMKAASSRRLIEGLNFYDLRSPKGAFVFEYSQLLPLSKESYKATMLDINELIIRSFTSCVRETVGGYIEKDLGMIEKDPVYSQVMVTPQGLLRYRETTLDINQYIFWKVDEGEVALPKETSLRNFLLQAQDQFNSFNFYINANAEQNPFRRLALEANNADEIAGRVTRLLATKGYLLMKFFVESSGLIELLQSRSRGYGINEQGRRRVIDALSSFEQGDASGILSIASIPSNFDSRVQQEMRNGREYGYGFIDLTQAANNRVQATRKTYDAEYQRFDWDNEKLCPGQPIPSLEGEAGFYGGYQCTLWAAGAPNKLEHYLKGFKDIMGTLGNQVTYYQAPEVESLDTTPVYLIITSPFRANLTFCGRIIKRKPYLGIRVAFGSSQTKGTEKDPAISDLREGFQYGKRPY